jgi:hypothetical protein
MTLADWMPLAPVISLLVLGNFAFGDRLHPDGDGCRCQRPRRNAFRRTLGVIDDCSDGGTLTSRLELISAACPSCRAHRRAVLSAEDTLAPASCILLARSISMFAPLQGHRAWQSYPFRAVPKSRRNRGPPCCLCRSVSAPDSISATSHRRAPSSSVGLESFMPKFHCSTRPQHSPGRLPTAWRPDSYVTFINGCAIQARIPMPRCAPSGDRGL